MIDIAFWLQTGLAIIGGATIIFRALVPVVELTKNTIDNTIVENVLEFLKTVTEVVSLNKATTTQIVKIKVK